MRERKITKQDINKEIEDELLKLLKRGIEKALRTFYKNDFYLIENDLHEMAITHRIAIYLDEIFSEYHVDCEWNRNCLDQKRLLFGKTILLFNKTIEEENKIGFNENNNEMFNRLKKLSDEIKKENIVKQKISSAEGDEETSVSIAYNGDSKNKIVKKVRPDIIIHKRKTNINFAVIEVKKADSTKNYIEKDFDLFKLHVMTRQNLDYHYGFYIELPKTILGKEIKFSHSDFLEYATRNKIENIFEIKFI